MPARKSAKTLAATGTKPAILRLAKRAGIKRAGHSMQTAVRERIVYDLWNILKDATTYAEHAKRKTVMAMDVVDALKRQGRIMYGFGVAHPISR